MKKNWIKDVTKGIKAKGTEGKCTLPSKPGCTGKAKILADTFRKLRKRRSKK